MSADRTQLNGDQVQAFHGAFEKRHNYIRAEAIHLLIDGEDRVPLPGCPECGVPAGNVMWNEYETELTVDVDPCGHRFLASLPIEVVTRDAAGQITSITDWHL
ncbi:hypothetical protein ACFWR9_08865 [Streptomyces sp. NPDC058534]|uniref:hypothetical protein n=1 Tax=Streptomyces sp. NPDC058534 TaxID=3346541 RepID=UPI003661F84D